MGKFWNKLIKEAIAAVVASVAVSATAQILKDAASVVHKEISSKEGVLNKAVSAASTEFSSAEDTLKNALSDVLTEFSSKGGALKDAVSVIQPEFSTSEKLLTHLHAGVFLNQEKTKYWIDKKTGANSFMVYARDLSIDWSEDKRYWKWTSSNETSDVRVEVAELINVCWLEIQGKFDTSMLSPNIMYEIVFIVKLTNNAYGWEVPVNIKLVLPGGETKTHKETLLSKPKGQWIELKVGEFYTSPNKMGEMVFSMFEYERGNWKKGLLIKGAAIRPKK